MLFFKSNIKSKKRKEIKIKYSVAQHCTNNSCKITGQKNITNFAVDY